METVQVHKHRAMRTHEQESMKQPSTSQPASEAKNRRLGELLIEARYISPKQLMDALSYQKEKNLKLGAALIDLGYLKESEFTSFLAKLPGIASIDLLSYEIPRELINVLPRDLAAKYELIPLDRLRGSLSVAMAYPLDKAALEEVAQATGLKIRPLLATRGDVMVAIRRFYAHDTDRINHIYTLAGQSERGVTSASSAETHHTERTRSENEAAKDMAAAIESEPSAQGIHSVTLLPLRSNTASAIRSALATTSASVEKLSDILLMDPAAAANVLHLANDGENGFPRQVATLDFAVSLVGLRGAARGLLSAPSLETYHGLSFFDQEAHAIHSLCCASGAKIISNLLGGQETDATFTAGLLHHMGGLALYTLAPHMFNVVEQGLTTAELCAIEHELFGLSHAAAGGQLADSWSFPVNIADAIRYHHDPTEAERNNVTITAVAVAAAFCDWETQNHEQHKQTMARVNAWLKAFPADPSATAEALFKAIHLDEIQKHWRTKWQG